MDNGQEFFEIESDTGGVESLDGLTLIIVEGDSASNPGEVDQVINLSPFSTGANGLFLWADAILRPGFAAAAGTSVHIADFFPDLENGTSTYILVRGFTGFLGDDLDADDDGMIDKYGARRLVEQSKRACEDVVLERCVAGVAEGTPEWKLAVQRTRRCDLDGHLTD